MSAKRRQEVQSDNESVRVTVLTPSKVYSRSALGPTTAIFFSEGDLRSIGSIPPSFFNSTVPSLAACLAMARDAGKSTTDRSYLLYGTRSVGSSWPVLILSLNTRVSAVSRSDSATQPNCSA